MYWIVCLTSTRPNPSSAYSSVKIDAKTTTIIEDTSIDEEDLIVS